MSCKVILTSEVHLALEPVYKSESATIQMKAIEVDFPVVLCCTVNDAPYV